MIIHLLRMGPNELHLPLKYPQKCQAENKGGQTENIG